MSKKQTRPYGRWPSTLSAELVCLGSSGINFLRAGDGGLYFVNSLPDAKDQLAVWHLSADDSLGKVSADGFNVRSRVHEYGGMPYVVNGNTLYFCNFVDQVIYKQPIVLAGTGLSSSSGNSVPVALTSNDELMAAKLRYVDLVVDKKFNRLICVREDHRDVEPEHFDASKVINTLVAIDLDKGGEGEVLFEGSDFVSAPHLSPDGETLVWQTWSHPNMPWDNTEIRLAEFDGTGQLSNVRQVHQAKPGSLIQPQFDARGQLYFIADWTDFWNLYRVSSAELKQNCHSEAVLPMNAEFAPAPWISGHCSYVCMGEESVAVSFTRNGLSELGLISDLYSDCPELTLIQNDFGLLENLSREITAGSGSGSGKSRLYFLAATQTSGNAIASVEIDSNYPTAQDGICYHSVEAEETKGRKEREKEREKRAAEFSVAEIIRFATAADQQAYGNLYLPNNSNYVGVGKSLPPLIVGVHGGPTSTAKAALNLKTQYWTNRGFAVLDVNHRGSTGFGRQFRRTLYGQWGVVDLEDVMAAVRYLITLGRIDKNKVVIHGGSAGGYSVMAALSQCDLFAAGASYYGVSDLEVLARGTHKFESRYLDQLIGPYPEARQLYRERSPIHNIDQITAPLLILQGLEDKIVPPDQALGIRDKLRDRGVAVEYLPFAGEGHGFRKLENQLLALQAELDFYRRVLRL